MHQIKVKSKNIVNNFVNLREELGIQAANKDVYRKH
jgi:hypothetical protein